MKRSDAVDEVKKILLYNYYDMTLEDVSLQIMDKLEELGMLPPVNECRLIPDTLRGGVKHSPAERKWDNE